MTQRDSPNAPPHAEGSERAHGHEFGMNLFRAYFG
jgi:hypothetical protein